MIKLLLTISLFYCINSMNAQINQIVEYKTNKKMLLGTVNKKGFDNPEFSWFQKNYDTYQSNEKIVKTLKKSLKGYKIKAFIGTWCGDTKRNLPRFNKVLDDANFDTENLEIYAVDTRSGFKKQTPNRDEKGLYVYRVPTFIFYKEGKEIGRIVEYPVETFERDILSVISSKKHDTKYLVAEFIANEFRKNTPIDKLKTLNPQKLARVIRGTGELNTFGYVLLNAKEYEKAFFVLELNTKIFSKISNTFDSLGEAYFETKQYTKALEFYEKALALKPSKKDIEPTKEKIEKIKKLIK